MKKLFLLGAVSASVLFSASPAQAAVIDLSALVEGLAILKSLSGPSGNSEQIPPPVSLHDLPQVPALPVDPVVESLDVAPVGQIVPVGQERRVLSTAYCLTGRMSSGKPAYQGAAAMSGVPLGSKFRVLDGPHAGDVFTIEDRLPKRGVFDIAYPGKCGQAVQYGRRSIRIHQAGL